ncbi:hypothetical protein HS961_08715 [Comamonas piscis]|uniref:Uncharacterized protein n=1 Tax=Comamonas piscis TaxID=1562974 RepID=A0A7G5EFZ0_9BURK|nr:hypothetical protein [Comamonas piscis]QMV72915.1 hypothetical protein HS961_08715 [Comamonas piscis]WSO35696.1 hypothetical protein VUJ63_08740 [Comamonas piscis]
MQHSPPPPTSPAPLRGWQRAALWLLVLVLLGLVFMLYTQPAFMVQMADHVWACF